MASVTKSGAKTIAYRSVRGTAVTTGALTANAWYEILTIGGTTALPTGFPVGAAFKTPDTSGTAITLAAGDSVYPLTLTQMFKTDANVQSEEGTVDVTDDSNADYISEILDGYRKVSGTLNGFAKVDDATGVMATDTSTILDRFFAKATDDGEGVYTWTAPANEKFLFFMCLNKDAVATGTQNWLVIPILLTSVATGAGLKDAQKRDLNWVKAEGPCFRYTRVVFTADLIA